MSTAASTSLPVLAGLLLAAALAACGDAPQGNAPADGARLFVLANCTTCHATNGQGTPLGPPLRGLDAHWTRESLAEYLTDPKAAIESNQRLKTLSLNFSMHMPPVVNFTPEQRLAIADHALALSAKAR
jgi:cytochrome c2